MYHVITVHGWYHTQYDSAGVARDFTLIRIPLKVSVKMYNAARHKQDTSFDT